MIKKSQNTVILDTPKIQNSLKTTKYEEPTVDEVKVDYSLNEQINQDELEYKLANGEEIDRSYDISKITSLPNPPQDDSFIYSRQDKYQKDIKGNCSNCFAPLTSESNIYIKPEKTIKKVVYMDEKKENSKEIEDDGFFGIFSSKKKGRKKR